MATEVTLMKIRAVKRLRAWREDSPKKIAEDFGITTRTLRRWDDEMGDLANEQEPEEEK